MKVRKVRSRKFVNSEAIIDPYNNSVAINTAKLSFTSKGRKTVAPKKSQVQNKYHQNRASREFYHLNSLLKYV